MARTWHASEHPGSSLQGVHQRLFGTKGLHHGLPPGNLIHIHKWMLQPSGNTWGMERENDWAIFLNILNFLQRHHGTNSTIEYRRSMRGAYPLSLLDPIAVQVLFKIENKLKSAVLPPSSPWPRAEASWKRFGDGKTPIAFEAAAS